MLHELFFLLAWMMKQNTKYILEHLFYLFLCFSIFGIFLGITPFEKVWNEIEREREREREREKIFEDPISSLKPIEINSFFLKGGPWMYLTSRMNHVPKQLAAAWFYV